MKNHKIDKTDLLSLCLPGLFFSFTVFIFAPIEFYLTHSGDFWFSIDQILPLFFLSAFICFSIITIILKLLPNKSRFFVEVFIIALTLLMYIQGNYLVKNYGTLNGAEIDWNQYTPSIIINGLIWIFVIIAMALLYKKFGGKFTGFLHIAAGAMLCIEIVSLAIVSITQRKPEIELNRFLSKKNEFTLSSGNNAVVILLDCFDAQLLLDLYETDHAYLDDVFEGFTFYRNTVGGAARTKYAIPYIFTGKTNTEEISYQEYLKKSFPESEFFKNMRKENVDVGLYTNKFFVDLSIDDIVENISTGKAEVSSKIGLLRDYMKLIAFRYVPDYFARYFWMYSGDFDHWKAGGDEGEYATNDIAFYQELLNDKLEIGTEKSVFRFYHLNGAHEPYTMDENGLKKQSKNGTEAEQAMGCIKIIEEYINQMKNLGIYDQANVIIMSDHGYGKYSVVEQNPIFLVKKSDSEESFSISEIPLSYHMLP